MRDSFALIDIQPSHVPANASIWKLAIASPSSSTSAYERSQQSLSCIKTICSVTAARLKETCNYRDYVDRRLGMLKRGVDQPKTQEPRHCMPDIRQNESLSHWTQSQELFVCMNSSPNSHAIIACSAVSSLAAERDHQHLLEI